MEGPSSGLGDEDAPIAAINVIPLVDVVLVLLIIFMVTTVFTKDSSMKLDLPQASKANVVQLAPQEITVEVDKNDRIMVMGQPTAKGDLGNKIKSYISPSHKCVIVLRGDKAVAYGDIMPVLEEISHTGIALTLAYRVPTSSG